MPDDIGELKSDLRTLFSYYGSKETAFTNLMGALLLGVALTVLLPKESPKPWLFFPVIFFLLLDFLFITQLRECPYRDWAIILGAFAIFLAWILEMGRSCNSQLVSKCLEMLLIYILLSGLVYSHCKLHYYRLLRGGAEQILTRAEKSDRRCLPVFKTHRLVFSRYMDENHEKEKGWIYGTMLGLTIKLKPNDTYKHFLRELEAGS